MKPITAATLALIALAALPFGRAWSAEDSYRYAAPERLVAFGDVHGAHDALVKTLKAARVLDADAR